MTLRSGNALSLQRARQGSDRRRRASVAPPQGQQQTQVRDVAADNGLLSLIPFFDNADRVFSGQGINNADLALDVASLVPFGAIGRGIKGVKTAANVGKRGKKAATTAARKTATSDLNPIQKFGLRQEGLSKGIGLGQKVSGKPLNIDQADDLSAFASRNFKTGSPNRVSEDIRSQLATKKGSLDSVFAENPIKITPKQASRIKRDTLSQLKKDVPTLFRDGQPVPRLASLMKRFDSVDSIAELDKARSATFDKMINFGRQSAKDPEFELAARILRDTSDKIVTKALPKSKELKTFINKSLDVEDAIKQQARANSPGSLSRGSSLSTRALDSNIGTGLQGVVGRGLQKVGTNRLGAAPRNIRRPAAVAGIQAIGSPLTASGGQPQLGGVQEATEAAVAPQAQTPQQPQPVQQQGQITQDVMQQIAQQMVSQGAPLSDVVAAMEELQTFASIQDGSFLQPEDGLELNNTAITNITDLQSGLNSIDNLSESISNSSGNVPFLGSLLSNIPNSPSKRLRAEVDAVRQVVGKALEGGVLRKEDEEKYKRILPTVNDSDGDAQAKLQFIRADIENKIQTFIQNQQTFSGGQTLLSDQLGDL